MTRESNRPSHPFSGCPGWDGIYRPPRRPDGRLPGGWSSELAGCPGPATDYTLLEYDTLLWITNDDSHVNMTLKIREYVSQTLMWARVKEAAERGKQKWRVGDLLADERCSPAVLDLRSTHAGRTAPPVEEKDSEEEAEVEGMGDGRSKRSSGPRALGSGFSSVFSCLFKTCTFLVRASCFHTFYLLGALTVRLICRLRGAGVLPSSPTFGPGRQTGTGLYRLNADGTKKKR